MSSGLFYIFFLKNNFKNVITSKGSTLFALPTYGMPLWILEWGHWPIVPPPPEKKNLPMILEVLCMDTNLFTAQNSRCSSPQPPFSPYLTFHGALHKSLKHLDFPNDSASATHLTELRQMSLCGHNNLRVNFMNERNSLHPIRVHYRKEENIQDSSLLSIFRWIILM